jgi:parallel beta-helix repeat protein
MTNTDQNQAKGETNMKKAKTMKDLGRVLATLVGFGSSFVVGARSAQALTLVTTCGQTLSASGEYALAGDLDCSSTTNNGATITASNVIFHLAGHTLVGACTSGDGGIVVNPGISGVQIDGGTVSGFNDGIVLHSSASRVRGMTVTGACAFGIAVSGQNNRIETNVVTASGIDGIGLGAASGTIVAANHIHGNVRVGVDISNFSNDNVVENNIIDNNGIIAGEQGGVAIFNGTNNVIRNNVVNHNFDGILIESPGNLAQGNTVSGNVDAGILISQFGAPSVVKRNIAFGNGGSDLNDNSPGCDANTWKNNTFQTDLVAGTSDGGPGTGCIR